jgi:triphosphatase
LRVGMRRLRSLLRLVERVAGKETVDPLVVELRWLSTLLGPARDWDVFGTQTLATILPHLAHPQLRREGGRLRYRVTRTRRRCHQAATAAVTSRRFTRLMLEAGLFFHALQGHAPATEAAAQNARGFARAILTQHATALRKRGKGLREASPAERHRARIAAKRLRYTAEFFAPLFAQRRARAYVKTLAKLQGVLGQLNDIATAQRLLDEIVPAGGTGATLAHAAGMVRGWTAAAETYEPARIGRAWKSFTQLKPFWS